MKILVTGGSGFIGHKVIQALSPTRCNLVSIDTHSPREPIPNVDYRQASILDEDALANAIDGSDVVLHFAANPRLWAPRESDFVTVNVDGTDKVIRASIDAKVRRLIHCSTEAILIPPIDPESAWTEDTLPCLAYADMRGGYLRSKFKAEQLVRSAQSETLDTIIVNPTMPIGPGDFNLTPPAQMLLGFARREIPAYFNSTFNIIDVRDAAEAIAACVDRGRPGERYVIGGLNIELGQMLALLEQVTGIKTPKRQIPYAMAWLTAVVTEGLALLTQTPPIAPMAGVRLARRKLAFDCRKAQAELGLRKIGRAHV